MDFSFVQSKFGDTADLGGCSIGRNLNLLALRGYAQLGALSIISAPDVYDQVDNPTGTQRELKEKHARECLAYALDADALPAEEYPRFFPEILLNVRDTNIIELYDTDNPSRLFDFDSFSDPGDLDSATVGVRIHLKDLKFPKPIMSPQISRVDGNHRLHGVDEMLELEYKARDDEEEGDDEGDSDSLPTVPFSMLLNLNPNQEATLFRDINGEHEGMETAHLTTLTARIIDPEELRTNSKLRSLWLAIELAKPGRAFENMVFMGGSRTGVKRVGLLPPIKINTLKSTITTQLSSAPTVTSHFDSDPEMLLDLVDNFWKAVREVFPAAWANRRDYMLLQTIGLSGFAKFGGVLLERSLEDEGVDQADFAKQLAAIASKVPLESAEWPGIAGAGGAQVVADRLIKASESDEAKASRIKAKLKKSQTFSQRLGMSDAGLPAELFKDGHPIEDVPTSSPE